MVPFALAYVFTYSMIYLYVTAIYADPALTAQTEEAIRTAVNQAIAGGTATQNFQVDIQPQGVNALTVLRWAGSWIIGLFTLNTWNFPDLFVGSWTGHKSGGWYIKIFILEPMSWLNVAFLVRYIRPLVSLLPFFG